MEQKEVDNLSSLYGGYWAHQVDDFCYMTNPYFPSERLLEAMQANLRVLIKSYPSTNWYLSSVLARNLNLTHKEVVVANGASELINFIIARFVKNLAVPVPTFDEFTNRAKVQGKQVSPFSIARRFTLDIDEFISHVRTTNSNSALLIRPNNPTGGYVSKEELVHFLNTMTDLDLILVDESFMDFVDAEVDPSAIDLIYQYPNLMIIKSLSKNYGIPGLRLGYAAAGSSAWIEALRSDLPIWNINSLAQFFFEEMGDYLSEYENSCHRVRASTDRLLRGLEEVSYLYPYPTQGNFILCWVLYGFTAQELTGRLFEHARILINDCGSKDGLDDRFIRFASRTDEDNDRLLKALQDLSPSVDGRLTAKVGEVIS